MYQNEAEYYYNERHKAYWRLKDELANLREYIIEVEAKTNNAYVLWNADEENEELAENCSVLDEKLYELIRYEIKLEKAIAEMEEN